ncbi:MAG: hypothetical protein COS89_06085 [Deltaproteobacteria bacterium CG07_land_8_20_14_0_80_38_7]|nr:MAG: hypothetical protein COS89_06085 [Deltaproteobacteria bacterium CG07_land_8_20_14_0_80_38_7]
MSEKYIKHSRQNKHDNVLIVGIKRDNITSGQMESSLNELESLVKTAGGKVVAKNHQDVKK